MKKVDDKLNDVKNKTCEHKPQTTSETSNSESKVNKKGSQLRNIEEKSSLSSDEYENIKVSVGNQKKDAGPNSEEHSKLVELETSLQSHHTDGSDESDVVEHDVKVCDTCGDAGREDLLAICCRCTDGAEHTYCMRVLTDQVPKGDWLCEECKLEDVKNTNRQSNSTEQSSDAAIGKVSGKRRAEELVSSSFKKQALETKDVDRGKVKSIHQVSSDSLFGNELMEGSRSPATRPRLQSLRGAFSKSSSFSFSNARSKTKLVDEIVLQRQKSTKEPSSHDIIIAAKEMSKPMSFGSTNLGSFGPSGSKVKMLSPKSAHLQDLKSPKSNKERSFEKTNSVKLNSLSSAALTPKSDRLLPSRGETNSVSSASNAEVKPVKGDGKIISGLKSTNLTANTSAEAPVSLGQFNEQLVSSPTRVGTVLSSGIVNSVEQKSIDISSKVAISKESTNLADGTTTGLNTSSSCQNNKQTGNNVSAMKTSKDVKNRDNKLKDAIEAALLKKPGIYRKNKVSDQPDELSVPPTMNYEAAVPHSRNAGSLTCADVSSADLHGKFSQSSSVDHSKQSNGNSSKQSMILPSEGKHLTAGPFSHEDVALSFLSKNPPIPDHECIWQGSFEISRSGKTAEFWEGLQAHLSTSASPRVYEAVNKLPHKIHLNGVSRASAWPTQFENNGVKEDNIGIYIFAKDVVSYEKSYQVLLDDMIRGDLALIGSINGVELLIFSSNQLPEKSNRWNMLFFLWGVFRGKKKNSLYQIPKNPQKSCDSQFVSCISSDKILFAENAGPFGSVEQDKHVDIESKVNSNLQNSSHEKGIDNISRPVDSVNVVPVSSKEIISESHMQSELIKRPFIDLSKDDGVNGTSQTDTWHDAIGQQEGSLSMKQKSDLHGAGSSGNGERYFFPVDEGKTQQKPVFTLDLNEDISCVVGETDNIMMTKKDVDDNVASSLSLSLAFSPPNKDDEDHKGKGERQYRLFRDMIDKH